MLTHKLREIGRSEICQLFASEQPQSHIRVLCPLAGQHSGRGHFG
jgi:hypothetical protein